MKVYQIVIITVGLLLVSCKLFENNTPPEAQFIIDPDVGNIKTLFSFDASGCTDDQDNNSKLKVRWDWENDGVWDTEYTIEKITKHNYPSSGQYSIKVKVKDSEGLTDEKVKELIVNNQGPTALFSVLPKSGSTHTNFNFNASASFDDQDSSDVLTIRWDWENDGTWDTNYSTNKIVTHQFTTAGTYTVKMEVNDTEGL